MSRSRQSMILAFCGLTLLFAVVAAVSGWRLVLGAAAIAGGCAVWAALMSTVKEEHPPGCPDGAEQVVSPPAAAQTCQPEDHADTVVAASSAPSVIAEPAAAEPAAVEPRPPQLEIPSSLEPAAVVETVLVNARFAGNPVAAHLWLEDAGTKTLRLVTAQGPAGLDPTPVSSTDGLLGSALSSGTARYQRLDVPASRDGVPVAWRYALPLSAEGATGVLAVDFVGEEQPDLAEMTRSTSALRGAIGGSLALFVARLDAQTASLLLETAGELSRLLDPEDVVEVALERALALSGAETGSVMLMEAGGTDMRIVKAKGLPGDVISGTLVSQGEGIAGWVLASGRPLVVEDLGHSGPQSRRHGVLSAASVPIADGDGVLGVLNVGGRRFHARFSRSHVSALETIGRLTATALRNAQAVETSQDLLFNSLKALALAFETRDPYARGGTARVVTLATAMADILGLDETEAYALKLAALLHDIGMSAAGEGVALTNRPLSTVEWGMLKLHPQIAANILGQAPSLKMVVPIVFHHHEHFDGTGYSGHLAGDKIPLGARVLAVADAFVAMTSDRPYRSAMDPARALSEIVENSGTQFDPRVVSALEQVMSAGAERFSISVE